MTITKAINKLKRKIILSLKKSPKTFDELVESKAFKNISEYGIDFAIRDLVRDKEVFWYENCMYAFGRQPARRRFWKVFSNQKQDYISFFKPKYHPFYSNIRFLHIVNHEDYTDILDEWYD